ncbi:hypothetical protein ACTMTF_08095 [Nonomuraea sp. ZG12]|uniref:hypothetical protein n=1 Tax=Nonomuraea sp. ZG12 TaxID=3452207 RepID=UPI003F88AC9A
MRRLAVGAFAITCLGLIADLMGIVSFDVSEVWFLRGETAPGNTSVSITAWLGDLWAGLLQIRADAPGWFVALSISIVFVVAFGPRTVALRAWKALRLLTPLGILLGVVWLLMPWMERWPVWSWWSDSWSTISAWLAIGMIIITTLAAVAGCALLLGELDEGYYVTIICFIFALVMAIRWDGLPLFLKITQVAVCIIIPIATAACAIMGRKV